jgi:hypothetical protein
MEWNGVNAEQREEEVNRVRMVSWGELYPSKKMLKS